MHARSFQNFRFESVVKNLCVLIETSFLYWENGKQNYQNNHCFVDCATQHNTTSIRLLNTTTQYDYSIRLSNKTQQWHPWSKKSWPPVVGSCSSRSSASSLPSCWSWPLWALSPTSRESTWSSWDSWAPDCWYPCPCSNGNSTRSRTEERRRRRQSPATIATRRINTICYGMCYGKKQSVVCGVVRSIYRSTYHNRFSIAKSTMDTE